MAKVHVRVIDSPQSVADAMEGLAVSAPNSPGSSRIALVEAVRSLNQSAALTSDKARRVEARLRSTDTPGVEDIMQLSRLRKQAIALTQTTQALGDAVERYFVSYVTSLARPGEMVQTLLLHFDHEIVMITRDVLDSTSDEKHIPREILERCYGQALDSSGTLHADNYFISLGEASLGRPYGSDYHREAYYEPQNLLELNKGYGEDQLAQYKREAEQERSEKEEWIGFWVHALSQCPQGPTLFYPPAGRRPECNLAEVPHYLFRAFDHKSSGRNNQNIIASTESITTRWEHSRVDLLSRPDEEAAKMLDRHLDKPCFNDKDNADNLMSWSSSLLFVIQYAIWRCQHGGSDPAQVLICMVDTGEFPRGQFARDMSLIKAYRDNRRARIFEFRLEQIDYDNGEYLSQGTLYHSGRSCVVSLAQLIQAGLHDLYPELSNPDAKERWAKRVKELRSIWSVEHVSREIEIQRALKIAGKCFQRYNTTDVALLLLSFKPRKLRESVELSQSDFDEYGPREVQRYIRIAA
ncbi:hypothetical protein BJX66DRAFT_345955, partial [Aspergillus keveii]